MSAGGKTTSIFTDDSGARKRAVTLGLRGAASALGLGAAAVAVSMVGHVALPGLDAPLHIPGVSHTKQSNNDADPGLHLTHDHAPVVAVSSPSAPATSRAGAFTTRPSSGATPATSTTTSTNGKAKAKGKPTDRPTTAALPDHSNRPTAPPGKSKTSDVGQ